MTETAWLMTLLALLSAIIASAVTHWFSGRSKQTLIGCAECRRECQRDGKNRFDALFRMMRALVLYSDIPDTEKEKILNDRGM